MKHCCLFLLALVLASSSSVAQTVNLFDWSQGAASAIQKFVTYDGNAASDSMPPSVVVRVYKEFEISSPNGKLNYRIRLHGTNNAQYFSETGCYDAFSIVDDGGRTLLTRWGHDVLSTVENQTMSSVPKAYFIQVPLDDERFALVFGGLQYEFDDGASEMIIVVVSKDKATVVFDGPAFAYKYTAPPNFSMEFTDDVNGLLNNEGKYTVTEAALKPHNKFSIWREGNLLKYKRWK